MVTKRDSESSHTHTGKREGREGACMQTTRELFGRRSSHRVRLSLLLSGFRLS